MNFTCNVSVCFGLKVTGKLLPETERPAPEIVAEFTVTEEVPVDVRVTLRVPGQPIVTELKLTLVGETVRAAPDVAAGGALNGMDAVGLSAEVLFTVRFPVDIPDVSALYCTSSVNC